MQDFLGISGIPSYKNWFRSYRDCTATSFSKACAIVIPCQVTRDLAVLAITLNKFVSDCVPWSVLVAVPNRGSKFQKALLFLRIDQGLWDISVTWDKIIMCNSTCLNSGWRSPMSWEVFFYVFGKFCSSGSYTFPSLLWGVWFISIRMCFCFRIWISVRPSRCDNRDLGEVCSGFCLKHVIFSWREAATFDFILGK